MKSDSARALRVQAVGVSFERRLTVTVSAVYALPPSALPCPAPPCHGLIYLSCWIEPAVLASVRAGNLYRANVQHASHLSGRHEGAWDACDSRVRTINTCVFGFHMGTSVVIFPLLWVSPALMVWPKARVCSVVCVQAIVEGTVSLLSVKKRGDLAFGLCVVNKR